MPDFRRTLQLFACFDRTGKSSLINALLGQKICKTGILPTTHTITLLQNGTPGQFDDNGVLIQLLNNELLRDVTLCDSPGVNSVLKNHAELTENFVPHADLVLFVTSVERALSESERQFLKMIAGWKKKIIVIINKKELLNRAEQDSVTDFVRQHVSQIIGSPPMFLVSSLLGLRAKLEQNQQQLIMSGLATLENYIKAQITHSAKLQTKMTTPLLIAQTVLERVTNKLNEQQCIMSRRMKEISEMNSTVECYEKESSGHIESDLFEVTEICSAAHDSSQMFVKSQTAIRSLLSSLLTASAELEISYLSAYADFSSTLLQSVSRLVDRQSTLAHTTLSRIQRIVRSSIADDVAIHDCLNTIQSTSRHEVVLQLQRQINSVLSTENKKTEAQKVINDLKFNARACAAVQISSGSLMLSLFFDVLPSWISFNQTVSFSSALSLFGFALLPLSHLSITRKLATQLQHQTGSIVRLCKQFANTQFDTNASAIRTLTKIRTKQVLCEEQEYNRQMQLCNQFYVKCNDLLSKVKQTTTLSAT